VAVIHRDDGTDDLVAVPVLTNEAISIPLVIAA
jgi:hypothetical protein